MCSKLLAAAPFAVLLLAGCDTLTKSGDPEVPGLGFRYDADERWSTPNPTGPPGR